MVMRFKAERVNDIYLLVLAQAKYLIDKALFENICRFAI